ncbi:Methyltransferase type 11 [Hymenobacter roseosalivarius DSM 11622]|uniref:Methyltransferase type 11 n=1 Tax=Hymenobacter roseosalivarius DSM 11622 TaxID=645990 RepID=A0A1W1W051_9BACT|nr:class I SAM-dependent methyltransferase [Hymenobacter roseosalivarius]SMB98883.1 Methyltransferase type 11 [Hymenobacter roseosalivarius DSM 11622]
MDTQLEQIREQQKATWNKFSPGWRKWDDFTMDWLKPMGDEIIQALGIKPTDTVLDIAAGTGEPGLTIAALTSSGKVVITDLAAGMLEVARDKARKKGITNYETVVCDVSELPFADATFDAVSCRFGFMFFPDMLLAAKEMARVLKPGGKIAPPYGAYQIKTCGLPPSWAPSRKT